jgi:hypothetical protein
MSDTGIFHTTCGVENPLHPGRIERVDRVLVDTGAERSRLPAPLLEALGIARVKLARRFVAVNGTILAASAA